MELQVTVTDQDLVDARELTGIADPQQLVKHVLREFRRLELLRQTVLLGGSSPDAQMPPRRRPPDFLNDPDQDRGPQAN
jgi:hypothetical protein